MAGAIGVIAVLALLGSAAWACTPQATLTATPTSGPPGSNMSLAGKTFDATGQPVKLWWGGAGKVLLGTAVVKADRTFNASFAIPSSSGGTHIVSATQNDANGRPIPNSPVNTTVRVDGPAAAPAASSFQAEPEQGITEPAPAAAPVADAAPAPAAPTPAPVASAPRVRVAPAAPARPVSAAPAVAVAPAPVAAPAPEAAPAPVAAPAPAVAPEPAPSAAPARRSVMVSMAGDSDGSPALAIALVGIGLVLALGASAVVLAGRREHKAPARARR